MSCGVGHRHGLDPMLLWLWCRSAAAAPIQLLAWQLPYATGAALKKTKKKIIFSSVCWSLTASRSLLVADSSVICLHAPLLCCSGKTHTLPSDDRYKRGVGQVLYNAHALSRDKKEFIEPETGKDIQHKMVNPMQAVWALVKQVF